MMFVSVFFRMPPCICQCVCSVSAMSASCRLACLLSNSKVTSSAFPIFRSFLMPLPVLVEFELHLIPRGPQRAGRVNVWVAVG